VGYGFALYSPMESRGSLSLLRAGLIARMGEVTLSASKQLKP
jgi:hypothetical protein